MFDNLFKGLFDSSLTNVIAVEDFLICVFWALLIGLILAFVYMYKSRYTKSFVATLALLPAIVCVVIMMVNGNVGTGVAVAGAFSLVRFRSAPGSAKEIGAIFLAMDAGLIVGMSYLAYALLFVIVLSFFSILYNSLNLGGRKANLRYKTLHITIPEDLDYTGTYNDIFKKYTSEAELTQVRTTNMSSLFKLTYNITLKDLAQEKQMIDEIRCRNGNLEITVSYQENMLAEL